MAITNGYCTLAELKAFNNISTTNAGDDAVIEDIIEGVSRAIDKLTGRTFYARTETHYYDTPDEDECLKIEDDDLLTITTLTNGNGTVITSDYYKLYPLNRSAKREIVLTNTYGWYPSPTTGEYGAISVAGTWGYSATTPEDVHLVCMAEAMNEYHKRFGENAAAITTVTASGVVISPQGFLMSSIQKLRAYRRMT